MGAGKTAGSQVILLFKSELNWYANAMNPARILFLSHGGGPLPLLGDSGHRGMVDNLTEIARSIPKPAAILVISAHWEADVATMTTAANPALIYDYYGFPQAAYDLVYPCKGEPMLANRVQQSLSRAGIDNQSDSSRGLDHGVFVPLKIMYPEADIPCVQLSLLHRLDPIEHIRLGKGLASIDYSNLLLIGSGFSFHNMQAFFTRDTDATRAMNEQFEDWLVETCTSNALDEAEREKRLENWQQAPFARYCHPREEHLLPLHVCYGMAGRAASRHFEIRILGKKASMYLW